MDDLLGDVGELSSMLHEFTGMFLRALSRSPTSSPLDMVAQSPPANAVPIELLREWALVAMHREDCGLLGRSMTLCVFTNIASERERFLPKLGPMSIHHHPDAFFLKILQGCGERAFD